MAMPLWINSLIQNISVNDSVVLYLLFGSVIFVFGLCCIINCLKYRIPRTKQEIQLRLHKEALTKTFRRYLNMLTVTTDTTFDDALSRVLVLREADLYGFERHASVRRNTQSDVGKNLKDQNLTISMPEICHAAQNSNIALLPLDISVVKEILQHQETASATPALAVGRKPTNEEGDEETSSFL